MALHLPLVEDEIRSLCRGLGYPEVACLLFCLATTGTRILLQVCALGFDAGRVSKSCRGGNPTTQSWETGAPRDKPVGLHSGEVGAGCHLGGHITQQAEVTRRSMWVEEGPSGGIRGEHGRWGSEP